MSKMVTGAIDVGILKKAMDAALLRHKATANNIANVNTKGYKAERVAFEEAMKSAVGMSEDMALKKTNEFHIGGDMEWTSVKPEIVRDESFSQRLDGNNVDIDSEMVDMAANQLLYNALAQQVSNKISVLKYVINEGR